MAAPDKLSAQLQHLLEPYQTAHIGIKVVSLRSHKTLVSYHAKRVFNPASDLKLLTATAALLYLRPSFNFTTAVYTNDARIIDGVLQGDLYVKFTGDPSLTNADLQQLINQLKQRGIRRIKKRVYIDGYSFDQKPYVPGGMWDDQNACFSAPLTAFILNENCTALSLIVQRHPRLQVKKILHDPLIRVRQHVSLLAEKSRFCPLDLSVNQMNSYDLSGCAPLNKLPKQLKVAIKNSSVYSMKVLQRTFQRAGIRISAVLTSRSTPYSAQLLASHHSANLTSLIIKMLKESDNLYANSLFKTLGGYYFKRQGSWQAGALAVKKILQRYTSLDFHKIHLVDGDGESRYDVISPAQLTKLLQYIYTHRALRQYILQALPRPGETDSTLCDRMQQALFQHHLWAKTGSMSGVSSLSGFIHTLRGDDLAFVIMMNGFVGKIDVYRQLQDNIVRRLIKAG